MFFMTFELIAFEKYKRFFLLYLIPSSISEWSHISLYWRSKNAQPNIFLGKKIMVIRFPHRFLAKFFKIFS